MKTFHIAVLAASLLIPLTGCGGPAPGDTEAPTNVPEHPGTDPFAGQGVDGKDSVLEAPALDLNDADGAPPP